MNDRKWTFARVVIGIIASGGLFGMALIFAADRPKEVSSNSSRRVIKIKRSSHIVDQSMEAQATFDPSKKSEICLSVKSGETSYRLETLVSRLEAADKSNQDTGPQHFYIESKLIEQKGDSKPEVLSRPNIRTVEGIPAVAQIRSVSGKGFTFEI